MNLRVCGNVLTLAMTVLTAATATGGPRAYGVTDAGLLFHFDVDSPANVTEVGNVGFVPEGIDFRPGTGDLYAIDVGPNTTQLYRINTGNAAPTAVGAGFNSSGAGYNLIGSHRFGFDFNPTTLQADDSMRIRLVGTNNTNLRLNSATGQIAGVDANLAFANGNSPFVDGAAYINNNPTMGGTTALYDMDSRNDALLLQDPPNAGTVATIGNFGVTVDAQAGIGFDIYTTPGDMDSTIGGDFAFAVLTRPDAPINGPLGAYLLYDVNLATGQITNGALVGPAATPYNFVGGFAVNPIPEPATLGLLAIATLVGRRMRRSVR